LEKGHDLRRRGAVSDDLKGLLGQRAAVAARS
jgi:hypothetical protein